MAPTQLDTKAKYLYGVLFSLLIGVPLVAAAGAKTSLAYSITLHKKTYVPVEPIIVVSRLKNVGKEKITVMPPNGLSLIVTYDLYRIDPNGRSEVRGRMTNGGPGWMPAPVTLEPNQVCESSYEVHRQLAGAAELGPGRYVAKGLYHLEDYWAPGYKTNVIASNEIAFEVKPMDANQALAYAEYQKCLQERDDAVRIAKVSAFTENHPSVHFRQFLLEELVNEVYRTKKDYSAIARICKLSLKGELSTCRRETWLYGLADALVNLGDVKEAVKVLSEAKLPENVAWRESLEKKLKAQ